MAYAASGLALISHSGGLSTNVYCYKTTDTLTTVMGSGYFNSAGPMLNVGDRILILSDQTVDATDEVVVTAASATAVTVMGRRLQSITREIVVDAALTTALTLTLPACTIVRAQTVTTTAFTGNTVTIALGTTAGGVDIVAATTIKAAGIFAHTVVAAAAKFAGGTLHITATQTATVTAVGRGILAVEYVVD